MLCRYSDVHSCGRYSKVVCSVPHAVEVL
jgi:hypothetical protein